jgi:hypothetical protein
MFGEFFDFLDGIYGIVVFDTHQIILPFLISFRGRGFKLYLVGFSP